MRHDISGASALVDYVQDLSFSHTVEQIHRDLARDVLAGALRMMDDKALPTALTDEEQLLLLQLPLDAEFRPSLAVRLDADDDASTPLIDPWSIFPEVDAIEDELAERQATPGSKALTELLERAAQGHRDNGRLLPARAIELRLPRAVAGSVHTANEAAQRKQRSQFADDLTDARQRTMNAMSLGALAEVEAMSPSQLARHASGKRHTIVLAPKTPRAVDKCRQYLMDFAEASQGASARGAVTLVVVRADMGASWPKTAGLSQVQFSGALSPEEMKAYVGMRMIGRRGPGSTALTQHLVAEFAGFDAGFAEELMRLGEQDLLELPQSLSLVAHRMSTSDAIWRESRFDTGSVAEINGDVQAHVLHEWHLASHEGPMREAAARSIASRYWRAALHALMPWLEERRHRIVTILTPALEAYLAPTGGVKQKTSFRGDRVIEVAIPDLECNDIVQMQLDRQNRFVVFEPHPKAAADICFKVTKVRNDLAHMKCPDPSAIIALVQSMDELLRDSPYSP